MRKYKQVREKKVIYSLDEWAQIEERAASASMKTSAFIRRMSLGGKITHINMEAAGEVMKALRVIGNNIDQIAKKANETNNFYADDLEELRKENAELCHTLNQFLTALPSIAA